MQRVEKCEGETHEEMPIAPTRECSMATTPFVDVVNKGGGEASRDFEQLDQNRSHLVVSPPADSRFSSTQSRPAVSFPGSPTVEQRGEASLRNMNPASRTVEEEDSKSQRHAFQEVVLTPPVKPCNHEPRTPLKHDSIYIDHEPLIGRVRFLPDLDESEGETSNKDLPYKVGELNEEGDDDDDELVALHSRTVQPVIQLRPRLIQRRRRDFDASTWACFLSDTTN